VKIIWSDRALSNMTEIGDYIAQDRPQAARQLVARLRKRVQQLKTFPRSGRKVEAWNQDDLRETVESGYRIVYQIQEKQIEIVTVFDGRRMLPISLDDVRE
jgi:addiction module RelE/StbE family toxin